MAGEGLEETAEELRELTETAWVLSIQGSTEEDEFDGVVPC